MSDDSKHCADTTTSHSKRFIGLIREKSTDVKISTIWENTGGCAEQYRCASAIYLMSFMSQSYCIRIDRGIIAPGHGNELVNGLNEIDNRYIYIY